MYPGWWVVHRGYTHPVPSWYCQGPTHVISEVIRVPRVPYDGSHGCHMTGPRRCPRRCPEQPQERCPEQPQERCPEQWFMGPEQWFMGPEQWYMVPNSAKQCQNGVKTVPKQHILRCTHVSTRPFDWFYDILGGRETCIPTARYL